MPVLKETMRMFNSCLLLLQFYIVNIEAETFIQTEDPRYLPHSSLQSLPLQSTSSTLSQIGYSSAKQFLSILSPAPQLQETKVRLNGQTLSEPTANSGTEDHYDSNKGKVLFQTSTGETPKSGFWERILEANGSKKRTQKRKDEKSLSVIRFVIPQQKQKTTETRRQEVSQREEARAHADNLPKETLELFNKVRSLNRRQSTSPGDINNPENFNSGSSVQGETYQVAIGGRCFSTETAANSDNIEGTCQSLNNCPSLQPLLKQLQYNNVVRYMAQMVCRFDGDLVYFCCPPPTNSVLDLVNLVDLPELSPVSAPIPGIDECGKVFTRPSRIIGGDNVTEGEFPWLAVLGHPLGFTDFITVCSGSLITRRHVMTAAHCFRSSLLQSPSRVRLGELDLNANSSPRHQEFVIISWHAPLYYYSYTINDIMIVTLDKDVQFNDFIQPGCLPFSMPTAPDPGETVTAVGYGLLSDSFFMRERSRYPQKLDVPVETNLACQAAYYEIPGIYIIDDRVFCSGGLDGKSTCRGDSGGPLHLFDEDTDRYLIVGITNAGALCGSKYFPRIDLRVGAFLPWIRSVVGDI